MFATTEQITEEFIKDGWNKNISFHELSLNEAKEKGYTFAINGINEGKKYFVMNGTENVYNDNGKIVHFNIKADNLKKRQKDNEYER